jgi:hypothetical protein
MGCVTHLASRLSVRSGAVRPRPSDYWRVEVYPGPGATSIPENVSDARLWEDAPGASLPSVHGVVQC